MTVVAHCGNLNTPLLVPGLSSASPCELGSASPEGSSVLIKDKTENRKALAADWEINLLKQTAKSSGSYEKPHD